MADPTEELVAALRTLLLDDVAGSAVAHLEGLRSAMQTIGVHNADTLAEATLLHRFSIALDRLHRDVARLRDVKLATLRDDQKWTVGRIARHTSIERTLTQKLIVKGRQAR